VARLLKNYFNFTDVVEKCDFYYAFDRCEEIFKCFLESNTECPDSEKDIQGQLKENLSALLFRFIYLKIKETFNSCVGGSSTVAILYILDYIKYAELSEDTLKEILKYDNAKFTKYQNIYFTNLINKLLIFLNEVKKMLKNKKFNLILYKLVPTYDNFKLLANPYYFDTWHKKFIPSPKNIISPEIKIDTLTYIVLDNKYPFKDSLDSFGVLKFILEEGYYASLTLKISKKEEEEEVHVIIITAINGDDLVIKNTWGQTQEVQKDENEWCHLIRKGGKINFKNLITSGLNYNISFFYNVPDYHFRCFMYNSTSLVTQLLKQSFPTFFPNVRQQCGFYYKVEINIFDSFLESKNDDECAMLDKEDGWLKENFFALLFHFIFLKMKETFKSCVGNSMVPSLYILDYIKYAKISESELGHVLNYWDSEFKYNSKDRQYFNKLLSKLYEMLTHVQTMLKSKKFNPICYYLNIQHDKLYRLENIYYFNSNGNKFVDYQGNIILPELDSFKYNREEKDLNLKDKMSLATLIFILKIGYYAFINIYGYTKNSIITAIHDENLVIKNTWEKDKCFNFTGSSTKNLEVNEENYIKIPDNCKINFNDLKKSTLFTDIYFFYNGDLESDIGNFLDHNKV
jgi:hypothetical protein